MSTLSPDAARQRLGAFLATHHPSVKLEDLEPSRVPGYWRLKSPCEGSTGCLHSLHATLLNDGPCHHTIQFAEPSARENGAFASPYRVWRALTSTRAQQ